MASTPTFFHTKNGVGRRFVNLADLCHPYGLEPGEPVVLEASPDGILLRPLETVIREVKAVLADIAHADGLISDELIRERREEAERESRS